MSCPNVILITSHDLGCWLDCYERTGMHTPHLQQLADEGVCFTRHFCTAPQCSPSRGSIVTGRYPHSCGLMGLTNIGWDLPDEMPGLPHYLHDAGYETILCGVQHERQKPDMLGYNRIHGGHYAQDVMQHACAFLKETHEKPFFLAIGTAEPHRPFHAGEMTPEEDVPMPAYLPDLPEIRKEMAGFRSLVQQLDVAMGSLLQTLSDTGLAENTFLIFTTDHGIDMPLAKGTLYDAGIEAALLMRLPGQIAKGRKESTLASNVDLLPTIFDALSIPIPEGLEGKSLWPLLTGGAFTPRSEIFAEKTHHVMFDPMRCIRTERYKYIDNLTKLRPLEIPASPEMDVPRILPDVCNIRRPVIELYDLDSDPNEQTNLAGQAELADVEADLRARLYAWMRETGDPLVNGVLPLPQDCLHNQPAT